MVCAAQPWRPLPWAQAPLGPPGSSAEPSGRAGTTWWVCRGCRAVFRRRGCARQARCLPFFFRLGCRSRYDATIAPPRPSSAACEVNISGYQGQSSIYPSTPIIIGLHRNSRLLTRKLQLARQPAGNDEDPTRPAVRTSAAGTSTSGLHSPGRLARMGGGGGTRQPHSQMAVNTTTVPFFCDHSQQCCLVRRAHVHCTRSNML